MYPQILLALFTTIHFGFFAETIGTHLSGKIKSDPPTFWVNHSGCWRGELGVERTSEARKLCRRLC